MIEIIIPYHSNKKLLYHCVDSLMRTTPKDTLIYIISNNSKPSELDIHFSNTNIKIEKFNHELYYPVAINYGVELCKGENIILADTDTFYLNGWLEKLLSIHNSDKKIAITGSNIIDIHTSRVRTFGIAFNGYNWCNPYRGQRFDNKQLIQSQEFQAICSASCIISKKAFVEVGGFNNLYNISYCDIDLCLRLRGNGYKVYGSADSIVYHKGNASGVVNPIRKSDCRSQLFGIMGKNMVIDMDKYLIKNIEKYSNKNKISKNYFLINLSSIINVDWYKDIFENYLNTKIPGTINYAQDTRDLDKISLYLTIDHDQCNNKYPFIYFTDNFLSMSTNKIWNEIRNNPYDIIIDRHGNIETFSDIAMNT